LTARCIHICGAFVFCKVVAERLEPYARYHRSASTRRSLRKLRQRGYHNRAASDKNAQLNSLTACVSVFVTPHASGINT
jgi:hypothetical protein